ncbi:chemotaxis protein CheA [Caldalkalibacillus salinus]|uniref:chemotaxis protein CheA n=1 Tax=Caldalkalibacillus salinus TaxID=2803787 RepID=UPI0019206DAC|nr:chemotaxis protein CheA [Caldalkalibacillus salinus]
MDMNQYLDMFIDEAREHLQAINDNLLEFEKRPDDLAIVNEIFRSAHTLKGMAATMGFEDLATLTHEMENVLDKIRNDELQVDTNMIDVIFKSVDSLESMVHSIIDGGDGKLDVTDIVSELSEVAVGGGTSPSSSSQGTGKATSASDLPFDINDIELTIVQQSIESGYQVYAVEVQIRSDCLLKSARAYMVFTVLEEGGGEVIKAIPSVEDIEQELFDSSFEVLLVSKLSGEEVQKKVMNVAEIVDVEVQALTPELLQKLTGVEQSVVVDASTEPTESTSSQPQASAKEQQQEAQKQTAASAEATAGTPPTDETEEKSQSTAATPAPAVPEPFSDAVSKTETQTKSTRASNRTIRVSIDRLDVLMNLFSELIIDRGRLEQLASEIENQELLDTVEHMGRISGDLQDIILNMRMVPIEQVFNRFPRMVRGLAKDLDKKVELNIAGADTELDRTVIDEIGDPIVHLLRNALDHGLETPEERVESDKEETGLIKLRAFHSGNNVFIEISDDGRGIHREKILERAIDRGIVTEEQGLEMTDQEVYQLLFASGFSTAEEVSDISGRGVGLDVVKNKIESLSGIVTVNSIPGAGTTFSIQLPLTLSIITSMLVKVSTEKYAIPLNTIEETAVIPKADVMSAHSGKVIDYRGKVIPLVFLREVFGLGNDGVRDDAVSVVIVKKGDEMAGLVVDSFIGQQEVVLKSLGNYLTEIFAISGATILGDGQVALIIDTNALVK